MPEFDTGVPHIARIYDYWLGGKDNFAADRDAAELAMAATPTIVPGRGPTGGGAPTARWGFVARKP